jgi:uncharacterized lipoprotein YmbA
MKKRILAVAIALTLSSLILLLVGCAGRSKPSRFYVLSPMADPEFAMKSASEGRNDISIGIFPVSLPKYLKKQQIVTRTGDNELYLAEYDRWAGRIEEDIGRVIAENLSLMLATDQILSYPPIETNGQDYNIQIVINRFDGRLGGEIQLIAQWAVFDGQGKKVYGVKTTHIREPARGNGYADMVAAQSRALAVFSHELADVIKELTEG